MPEGNAVRVEHRHKFEDKAAPESSRALVCGAEEECKKAVEKMAAWRLPRVHAGADKNHLQRHSRRRAGKNQKQ